MSDGGAAEDHPRTVGAFLRMIGEAYGGATAIRLQDQGGAAVSLSFGELDGQSRDLARGLLAMGVGKGARIGMQCGNGPDFALWLMAIARIGAVAMPFSTMLRGDELLRTLAHSDCVGLIVQREVFGHDLIARLGAALPELAGQPNPDLRMTRLPALRWIASSGEGLPPYVRQIGDLRAAASAVAEASFVAAENAVCPDDQAIEIYTSGSMALPKGVRHTHGALIARSLQLRDLLGRQRGTENAVHLPMFWVGGLMTGLMPNLAAGVVSLCSGRPALDARFAMGGIVGDDELAVMARNRPYWGLGMTETLGPYAYGDELRAPGFPLCAPMDYIVPGFELRVIKEDGTPAGDGESGEIELRGPAVTRGLHKVDAAEMFTSDGFLRTGDIGLWQGRRLHFIGRKGDMIKTGGANVSPTEVEGELTRIAGVAAAYVVGIADAARGELVVAVLIAGDGCPDDTAISATLKERLSSYKVPRAYVRMAREDVPLLASNKVARKELARMVALQIGGE